MKDVNESTKELDMGNWTAPASSQESPAAILESYQKPLDQPSVFEVSGLLEQLPQKYADEYSLCLKVGLCLYHEYAGGEIGKIFWEDFCRKSDKFQLGWCDEKWATFGSDCDNPLTLGSLKHWSNGKVDTAKFQTFNLNELLDGDFKVDYSISGCSTTTTTDPMVR